MAGWDRDYLLNFVVPVEQLVFCRVHLRQIVNPDAAFSSAECGNLDAFTLGKHREKLTTVGTNSYKGLCGITLESPRPVIILADEFEQLAKETTRKQLWGRAHEQLRSVV